MGYGQVIWPPGGTVTAGWTVPSGALVSGRSAGSGPVLMYAGT